MKEGPHARCDGEYRFLLETVFNILEDAVKVYVANPQGSKKPQRAQDG